MAFRYVCGFNRPVNGIGGVSVLRAYGWGSIGAHFDVQSAVVKSGPSCLRLKYDVAGANPTAQLVSATKNAPNWSIGTGWLAFHFRITALPTGTSVTLFDGRNYSTIPTSSRVFKIALADISGNIRLQLFNAGTGSNGTTNISTNTWYHVILHYVQNGTMTLYLNGTSEVTHSAPNLDWDTLWIGEAVAKGGNPGTVVYIDNVGVNDNQGGANNTQPPEYGMKHRICNADGDATGWTEHGVGGWREDVDVDFNLSDYWHSGTGTAEAKRLENLQPAEIADTDAILAVATLGDVSHSSGTNGNLQVLVKDNGTEYTTDLTDPDSGGGWNGVLRIDDVMPNGGAAWTETRFDAFQVGLVRASGASDMHDVWAACMATEIVIDPPPPSEAVSTPTMRRRGQLVG